MADTITITPVGGSTDTFSAFKKGAGPTFTPPTMDDGDTYWIDSPRYGSMVRAESDMRRSFGDPVKIDLGEVGRLIQFRVLVFGSDADDAMDTYITLADDWRGNFNTVTIWDKSFSNCSFMGDDVPGATWITGGGSGAVGYAITCTFQQVQT